MQETRTEWQGRMGAYTETLLCSDWFNVFVLQKSFFFVFTAPRAEYVCIVFIKIYMF